MRFSKIHIVKEHILIFSFLLFHRTTLPPLFTHANKSHILQYSTYSTNPPSRHHLPIPRSSRPSRLSHHPSTPILPIVDVFIATRPQQSLIARHMYSIADEFLRSQRLVRSQNPPGVAGDQRGHCSCGPCFHHVVGGIVWWIYGAFCCAAAMW